MSLIVLVNFILGKDIYFYENYEGARQGTEYGQRTSEVKAACGRKLLKLQHNLLPFYGGRTKHADGSLTSAYFDAVKYPYVSGS